MIHIEKLSVAYDKKQILKNINLHMRTCEITGIIGPNGSGKTTLLRAITKILKPKSGRIKINQIDIVDMSSLNLAKMIAVVSQYSSNAFDMSVEDYVLLGRIPYRSNFQFIDSYTDQHIARDSLALAGMDGFQNRSLDSLSAGERQLVLIARALTQQTKILLLDEPTSHLDIFHQIKILNLIKKLNRNYKMTFIIVMHDLNLASQYCDRLILLNHGQVIKQGLPEEVLNEKLIEQVYKTKVIIKNNPVTQNPFIILTPNQTDQKFI